MNVYQKAREVIEGKQQWSSGERVELYSNGQGRVYVKEGGADGGCLLILWYQSANRTSYTYAQVGMLSPTSGWIFTMTPDEYTDWAAKARRIADAAQQAAERRAVVRKENREAKKPQNMYPQLGRGKKSKMYL